MSEIPEDVMWVARGCCTDNDIAHAILAERKRCIGHVYGLAGSDNVAQRTVEAIRSGK